MRARWTVNRPRPDQNSQLHTTRHVFFFVWPSRSWVRIYCTIMATLLKAILCQQLRGEEENLMQSYVVNVLLCREASISAATDDRADGAATALTCWILIEIFLFHWHNLADRPVVNTYRQLSYYQLQTVGATKDFPVYSVINGETTN